MITKEQSVNRGGYIGGSDMGYVYGSYNTDTFKNWWDSKVTGLKAYSIGNEYIDAGNILESDILDAFDIKDDYRGYSHKVNGKIWGVQTDAYDFHQGVIYDAKTRKSELLHKIIEGGAIPINYRRQLYHGMFVVGAKKTIILICGLNDEDYENPFAVDVKARTHKFELDTSEFDFELHQKYLDYLQDCYEEMVDPSDEGRKLYAI